MTRQAGEVSATLSNATPPAVASATGLGTGGGAAFQADTPSEGRIRLVAGPGAAVGGNVVLKFAAAPPTLFITGADNLGTVTIAGQGTTTVTISWTAKLAPGMHRLDYEWSTLK